MRFPAIDKAKEKRISDKKTERNMNMKTMKNIVAALMAVAMLLAMSVPAFAAAEDGTITISNADAGTTYSAYKLLELSYEDHGNDIPTDDGYVYYLPDNTDKADWYDFLTGTGIKDTYISIDGNEIVTWKDGADAKAFAEAALKYAEDNTLGPVSSGTAVGVTLTLNAAGPGYYLVDSSMGALVVLTTATPNVTIEEKNDAPTIEKKVLEVPEDGGIEDGTWEDLNRVEAGDEIYYRIIINAKPGAQNYVVHDKMDTDHLQLVSGSLRVYLNDDGSQNEGNKVDAANYTLTKADAGETLEDGCAFNIAFDNEFLADLGEDDVITLYYRAHFAVDEEAVKKAPHSNTVWLTYGDDKARNKTVVDVVETVSYGLEILKYANGNVSLTLGGAQFEL